MCFVKILLQYLISGAFVVCVYLTSVKGWVWLIKGDV